MIYIPSYKRAGNCVTARAFKKSIICCHEFEAEEYRKWNENEILVMPDSIKGQSMALIRNWILDHSKEDQIVMMDDDIESIGYYEDQVRNEFTEQRFYEFIINAFIMIEELGTVLWGLNLLEDKKAYREYTPFLFSSVILGPCMGIKKSPIRFDERLGLKEDYDFAIQVLNKYRKILRFNKVHYRRKHITVEGGCASYRTQDKEKEQMNAFVKKWGSGIVKYKEGDINPIINVPIDGV